MAHKDADSTKLGKKRNFDDFLSVVGAFGRYQKIMAFCVILPAVIPSGFLSMSSVFLAATPLSFWCSGDPLNNASVSQNSHVWVSRINSSEARTCQSYLVHENHSSLEELASVFNDSRDCADGIDFDHSVYVETIVTEWDLVCNDRHKATWTFTIFTFGGILGPLIWGFIADRFGRKTGFFACILFQSIFNLSTSFAPNYIWFCIFRFLTGMTSSAGYTLPFVLLLEITGPESRAFFSVTLSLMYSIGALSFLGIAYAIRDWRELVLVTSLIAAAIYFVVFWFFPESPRWLLGRGKYKELEVRHWQLLDLLKIGLTGPFYSLGLINPILYSTVAKVNRKTLSTDFTTTLPDMLKKIDKEDHTKLHTVFDLFKTPNMLKKTVILVFLNVCNKGVSIGLNLYVPAFSAEPYWQAFLNCMVEWPCYLFAKTAFNQLGRRTSLFFGLLTGSIACLSTYFLPVTSAVGPVNFVLILTLIAKFCITFTYVGGKLFEDEIFPTVVRGEGHSVVSVLSSSISCGVPFVVALGADYRVLPLMVFGSLCFVAAIMVLFLPETAHQILPQTLEDGEKFGKNMTWQEMFRFLPVKNRLPDLATPVPSQPYELDKLVATQNGSFKSSAA